MSSIKLVLLLLWLLEKSRVDASVIETQGKTDDIGDRDKTDGIGRGGTKRNRTGNHDGNGQINRDGFART